MPLESLISSFPKNILRKLLLNGLLIKKGLLNRNYLNHILERTIQKKENHAERIWALLWLEIWFRIFIEKNLDPNSSLNKKL